MTKNVLPIVKENLPQFVRSDHPLFNTFIEAYYEFLERTNDSESTSAKDLFKKSPSPVNIINNISEYRDVDSTIASFIEYFNDDLVPFTITGNASSDGFILSKIRDIYLAKGTPNSFKLLFAMIYGEEIDVFETRDNILQSSGGVYVDFTQLKAAVTGNETELEDFNFELASIYLDSENGTKTATVIDGTFAGADRQGRTVLNIFLSAFPDSETEALFKQGRVYVLKDAINPDKYIDIKLMKHLSSITLGGKSSGHRVGDLFEVKDDVLDVKIPVSKITQGTVERIFARNRGKEYRVGDTVEFINENSGDGTGGIAFVTGVDTTGAITEIDGVQVRTLDSDENNRGILSDDFNDTSVPISQGGFYSIVPVPTVRSTLGTGAQFAGWSTSVGSIEELVISQPGFFDSDSVIQSFSPITFDIQDPENQQIEPGTIFEFQYFKPNGDFFNADSEVLTIDVKVFGSYDSETSVNLIQNDSDFHGVLDSDGFRWGWKRRTKTGPRIIEYREEVNLNTTNYSQYLKNYLGQYITLRPNRIVDFKGKTFKDIENKNQLPVASPRPVKTTQYVPARPRPLTFTEQPVNQPRPLKVKTQSTKDSETEILTEVFRTTFNLGNPLFFKSGQIADTKFKKPTATTARRIDDLTRERLSVKLVNSQALFDFQRKTIADKISQELSRLSDILKGSTKNVTSTSVVVKEKEVTAIETTDSDIERYTLELPVSFNRSTFTFETKNFVWYDSDIDSDFIARYVNDSAFNFRTYSTGSINGKKVFPLQIFDSELFDLEDFHFNQITGKTEFESNFFDGAVELPKNVNLSYELSTEVIYSPDEAGEYTPGVNDNTGSFISTGFGGKVQSQSTDGRSFTLERGIRAFSNKSSGDSELILPTVAQLYEFDNLNNAILRVVRINPKTGDVLTPNTFPVSNVITRYSSPTFTPNFKVLSRTQKRFLDESGFLSSVSGASLRDNFQISEYTYILQSERPISDWREKIKKTLHPAGLILLGELNVDSKHNQDVLSTATLKSQPGLVESSKMSFDLDDDYYDDSPAIGDEVFADATFFDTNPTNKANPIVSGSSTYLYADDASGATSNSNISQYGNSWWDYEPVGSVEKVWKVFDSEGHFNDVVNNIDSDSAYDAYRMYFYYNAKDNGANSNNWALKSNLDSDTFYVVSTSQSADSDFITDNIGTTYQRHTKSPNSRYLDDHNISTSRVYIDSAGSGETYAKIDSDLPQDLYAKMCSVSTAFKKIDYDRINSTYEYPKNRRRELMMNKAQDFNDALREDGTLEFKVGTVTYTNMDAYEQKYNTWNDLRDSDISIGWKAPGQYETLANIQRAPSDSDYNDSEMLIADTKIRNKYVIHKKDYFVKTKSPRTAVAYGTFKDSDRDFTLSVFPFVDEINNTLQLVDRDSDAWSNNYVLDRKRSR